MAFFQDPPRPAHAWDCDPLLREHFPNRPPFGIGTNYPDYVINPGHTVTAMLAALRYRNRTGKGQCIELPQLESVVSVLGTAVAEQLVNGTTPSRTGNRHRAYAPHGAFRCADDPESIGSVDRWVVLVAVIGSCATSAWSARD